MRTPRRAPLGAPPAEKPHAISYGEAVETNLVSLLGRETAKRLVPVAANSADQVSPTENCEEKTKEAWRDKENGGKFNCKPV